MRKETLAAQAAHKIDASTGAITTAIHMSTTFERDIDGGYERGYTYTRLNNPNRELLEQCIYKLEGGSAAACFASGASAASAIFQTLSMGDHVIAPIDCYHGTLALLRQLATSLGLKITLVNTSDPTQVEAAIKPSTKVIWVETPANPLLTITDISCITSIARNAGVISVFDNTLSTPMLQRPMEAGADLVVHSSTKYLGGHGDVQGGVVVGRSDDEIVSKIKLVQMIYGAVPSPFDCWLILRGIRTLHLRMQLHAQNAMEVAAFLQHHPKVETVYYPGLKGHSGHNVACKQMDAFGGIVSAQIKGGVAGSMEVAGKVRLFTRATSFGSTESLIEHRASIEGPETTTPDNLLRLSIGLENAEDLIDDLTQALA